MSTYFPALETLSNTLNVINNPMLNKSNVIQNLIIFFCSHKSLVLINTSGKSNHKTVYHWLLTLDQSLVECQTTEEDS